MIIIVSSMSAVFACSLFASSDTDKDILSNYEKVSVTLQVEDPSMSTILTRDAELIMRPGAQATIIFFHGFKGSKDDVRPMRALFFNYNTLILDFRAHGANASGQCCSFGAAEKYDVKAAFDFVKHHPQLKNLPIFGYGFSMGAASLIEAQAAFGPLFDALILDSPFDDIENVIKRGLRFLSLKLWGKDFLRPIRTFFERNIFTQSMNVVLRMMVKHAGMDVKKTATCLRPVSPINSIKKVTVPCLIISCQSDKHIPVDVIKNIFKGTPKGSELWIASGRHHLDAFFSHPEDYTQKVNMFLKKWLK